MQKSLGGWGLQRTVGHNNKRKNIHEKNNIHILMPVDLTMFCNLHQFILLSTYKYMWRKKAMVHERERL